MDQLALKAQPRLGGHPNRDRREGFVPAVVYDRDRTSRVLRVDQHQLLQLLSHGGRRHVIRLEVEGESAARTALVSAGRPLHVDVHAVSLQERVHAEVPLRLHGEEQITKVGGILQHLMNEVRVVCLPGDLPEWIEVDVSGLEIGQVLTVADLAVPAGVVLQHDPEEAVLGVVAPRLAAAEEGAEAAEAQAAAPSQPEVVGRKPREEAEGEEG
jgi:large subunit ribosomal protein L25